MKAARAYPITEHTTDLRVEYVEDPTPGAGEVLVQVTAAGVTPWDHTAATGAAAGPLILGNEGAGIVAADPAGRWAPGTRVMFFAGSGETSGRGTMAEFAVIPEPNLAEIPIHVADEVAAAVPIAYLTAVLALRLGGFSPGARVFAPAIGGSVGNATVQLARALGARVVAGGAGSTAKAEAVRAAPWARGITVVDLERGRLSEGLGDGFGDGIDLAVDGVGGAVTAQIAEALATGGRIVLVGHSGGGVAHVPIGEVVRRRASLHGFSLPSVTPEQSRLAWSTITELLVGERIHPVIDSIFPLDAAGEAIRHLVEDRPIGKVVITDLSRTR
ncbi:zinc-binding alcohol dehydrogenase family protein [Actinomadura sp. DC4]|uniref:quinone oxidoreductase family protein n=1 Tax=Actinomadura sp. DC4 TaxID=3055069 RepID=UPI0025AF5FF7|nr:zinc-binding alcohol dehydrogenase family protein [Actinomadura sp. DC4]MDN3352768.1 zinc-binding alcohol dehydrogenase family protein [Actinomadura sp. DC4]